MTFMLMNIIILLHGTVAVSITSLRSNNHISETETSQKKPFVFLEISVSYGNLPPSGSTTFDSDRLPFATILLMSTRIDADPLEFWFDSDLKRGPAFELLKNGHLSGSVIHSKRRNIQKGSSNLLGITSVSTFL